MNPYVIDRTDPVPSFDDAPGTHDELLRLREREREELCDFAQGLLSRLDAAA
ncbi:hypothetical protein [Mycolicibacterium conceptionense]|uniref:hypothetical protein n=1 Tax=Mycolicibacterium conceptionense TaxID=451644 RepID=UPI000B305E5D|nr:hypothetical protein [Mycolicibacterium conceptionense]